MRQPQIPAPSGRAKMPAFTAVVLRTGVFGVLLGKRRKIRAALDALEEVVNLFVLGLLLVCGTTARARTGSIVINKMWRT